MLSNYRDIIKAPIITEKSANIAADEKTYVFKVDVKANKSQIKDAIEKIFNPNYLTFDGYILYDEIIKNFPACLARICISFF